MKIKFKDEFGSTISREMSIETYCKLAIREMILLEKQKDSHEKEIRELKQQQQNIDIANKIFKLKMDIEELSNMQSGIHRKVIKVTRNENFWRENNLSIAEYFYDRRLKGE